MDSFIDDLSSADSKGLSYQDCEVLFHVNKQSPDTAGCVHVGKEHQPRISRIYVEVDIPVSPGRLAPCDRVQKRLQHEQQHKPQQQAEQTASGKTLEQKFVEEVRSDNVPAIRECDKDATVT